MDSLPMSTAPALYSRATQVASSSGTRCSNGSAPQVVVMPLVSERSFTPARERTSGANWVTGRNASSSRSAGAFAVLTLGMVVSNRCGPLMGVRPGSPGWNAKAGSVP